MMYMTQNIFYRFRPRSNFWYLTGFEEPDSALVLQKDSSAKGYKMTLLVRPKDSYDELWNGARSGIEGACEVFGADDAVDANYFTTRLRSLLSSSNGPVYIDLPHISPSSSYRLRHSRGMTRSFMDYLSGSTPARSETDEMLEALGKRDLRSAAREVEKLRLVKSEAEAAVMRRAADVSSAAHSKVMRLCRPGMSEAALVSHFEHHTSLHGSPRPAYVPVCASGAQALTIHYIENNRPCKEGEMVLLDAGCEWGGYASDITRTFPVSGRFSTAQKHLYEAVLRVVKTTTSYCKASSNLSLQDLHQISVDATRVELRDLGFNLRAGDLERVLYPHFVSHPLGVDLHDTMSFTRDENIKAGMVITIEPGIYVPPLPHFPKGFHNQVVRLEDEVLVQEDDYVVLSVNALKEIVDVEARCQGLLDGVGANREDA
ncbi:aminopeptidase [Rhodosporidiobolus nylandii]